MTSTVIQNWNAEQEQQNQQDKFFEYFFLDRYALQRLMVLTFVRLFNSSADHRIITGIVSYGMQHMPLQVALIPPFAFRLTNGV